MSKDEKDEFASFGDAGVVKPEEKKENQVPAAQAPVVTAEAQKTESQTATAVVEPPKKKRGRPPKNKTADQAVTDQPKKKRGRPAKTEKTVKGKRGRKRGVKFTPPQEGEVATEKKTRGRKPMPVKEKFFKGILRKAGVSEIPALEKMVAGHVGETVKLSEIGIFTGTPKDELLAEIAAQSKIKNCVAGSAEVSIKTMKKTAVGLLSSGRMYASIEVARLTDRGNELHCWSGRQRLAFLALAYGMDNAINVIVKEMTLDDAKEACRVANKTRGVQSMEKAEHLVVEATEGKSLDDRDKLYAKVVKSKSKVGHFCAYSVLEKREHGMKLHFDVSKSKKMEENELTATANLVKFWKGAIEWSKDMSRKEFDVQLKDSVEFLNDMVEKMKGSSDFDCKQHLSPKVLTAVGKLYRQMYDEDGAVPIKKAKLFAEKLVEMKGVGTQKADKTLKSLSIRVKKA